MARLIFRSQDGSEQGFELSGELTVGRDADNAVVLRDGGVSRHHCRFFLGDDGQVYVEDLGSSNGVYVGDERIGAPTVLGEGAQAYVGETQVVVEARRSAALARRPAPTRSRSSEQVPAAEERPAQALARRPTGTVPAARPRGARLATGPEVAVPKARPVARAEAPENPPRLRGTGGVWAGKTIPLDLGETVRVGRVPPAEIVLEDDSVSRAHAELVRSGDGFRVRDLKSANGTFRNGARVTEAGLADGDLVRFGSVEFQYKGPDAEAMAPGRKKMLIALGAAGAVLLLALIVATAMIEPSATPRAGDLGPGLAGAGGDAAPTDPVRLMARCRSYADPESDLLNWARAAELCGKTLELDPTLAEARTLERRAKKELAYEKLLADARLKIATGQEEAALKVLAEIDRSSATFPRARTDFRESAERIARRARSACKSNSTANDWDGAYTACLRAVEVTCNRPEGVPPDVTQLFEKAAKKLGREPQVRCPPEYATFQAVSQLDLGDQDWEAAVRARYTDAAMGSLMVRYLREGKAKVLAEELKRMRSRNKSLGTSLDEVISQLEIVEGLYAAGQAGKLRENVGEAENAWKQALEADARLMPAGVRSALAREIGAELANMYLKAGMDAIRTKTDYKGGFEQLARGYQYDKNNQDILVQLRGMEREARKALVEPSCENVKFALDITFPHSMYHKRAEEMRGTLGCR